MSDKHGDPSVPLKDAAHGRGERPGEAGRAPHRRAPFPAERSILWTPRRDAGSPHPPATSGPYELFIGQAALAGATSHVSADSREACFGFMVGSLFRCPDSGIHYALVDRTLAAAEPFSEDAPATYLLRAWADFQQEFQEHGGVLLGWYHSHYLLGLFLSEGDQETNRRYFAEPWQCCMLIVPDPERPMGAIFRPQEGGRIDGEPAPFRELLLPGAVPAEGPLPTVLNWTNYEADCEVEEVAAPVHGVGESEVEKLTAESGPEAGSPDSMTLVLAADSEERPFPWFPRHRLRHLGIVAALAVLFVAIFMVRGAMRRSAPAPTPTPAVSPEVRRFTQLSAELDGAVTRYGERSQDFDLGRIGCDLLASGYAATDDAFVGLAAAFASLAAAADSAATAEYNRLVRGMNEVNDHFDASGCQRPG